MFFFEEYTANGLRISGYGAAEVFIDFAEKLKHTEANLMCSIHQSRVAYANIRDQKPSFGVILISATPMLQNLGIGLKKRRKGKSEMLVKPRGKMYPEAEGETQNNILLTFRELVSTVSINN